MDSKQARAFLAALPRARFGELLDAEVKVRTMLAKARAVRDLDAADRALRATYIANMEQVLVAITSEKSKR